MTEVCHRLQCLNVFTGHLEPVQVFSARSEYFGTPSLVMGNSCSRAPWSEITEAGVTPSVILLFQPGPSSCCLFCGWLWPGPCAVVPQELLAALRGDAQSLGVDLPPVHQSRSRRLAKLEA